MSIASNRLFRFNFLVTYCNKDNKVGVTVRPNLKIPNLILARAQRRSLGGSTNQTALVKLFAMTCFYNCRPIGRALKNVNLT